MDAEGLPLDEARGFDAAHHARSVGVSSIPTFAVGTTAVVGAQPYEQRIALINHVRANKRM